MTSLKSGARSERGEHMGLRAFSPQEVFLTRLSKPSSAGLSHDKDQRQRPPFLIRLSVVLYSIP